MAQRKVLVIDDNPVVVRLDESLLSSAGYEVISATDGEDGFNKACTEKPDVILLDVVLPKIHGFELCQKIKNDPRSRDIPVIFVTGTGLEDVVLNEPGIKADGYLNKPYGQAEIEAAIKKVIKAD